MKKKWKRTKATYIAKEVVLPISDESNHLGDD